LGVVFLAKLWDIIARSAENALSTQGSDGSMPPGNNGPYRDPETPTRNTAHWLITFLHSYDYTQKPEFKAAAEKAAEYLMTAKARPMAQTFLCRTDPAKDFPNGLIGQAWVIEALAIASEKLHSGKYKELAENVFCLHPFDEKIGLWKIVNVDGSYRDFDWTFNHQLWFAAVGALLSEDPQSKIIKNITRFLDGLDKKLKVSSKGLISQPLVWYPSFLKKCKKKAFALHKRLRYINKTPSYKEAGYHAFNLYAMAMLKKRFPEHSFWRTDKFRRTLEYINQDEFRELLLNSNHDSDFYFLNVHDDCPTCNRYGYPYNPVGFEVAFAWKVFFEGSNDLDSKMSMWISSQFEHTFDSDSGMFSRNTEDPITLAARIYEATRLPNLEIDIS
jgi:hypothetical protein